MSKQITITDAAAHYDKRMAAFRAERVAPGGIVLVGSSHLEWFDAERLLPAFRFVNRAIASDRLGLGARGILHRLNESVFDVQPRMIVFNNSVNDLGELWRTGAPPVAAIRQAYEQVIGAIRAGAADVPLLIVNELPTCGRFAGLNPLIAAFNPYIAEVARRHGCGHLDIHSVIVNEAGELPAALTTDGLHLNEAGYEKFAEKLGCELGKGVTT